MDEYKKMCYEFHNTLKFFNLDLEKNLMICQDVVIKRVVQMPVKVQMVTELSSTIPKFIIKNIPMFEAIWTLLQVHPCYLVNIICRTAYYL